MGIVVGRVAWVSLCYGDLPVGVSRGPRGVLGIADQGGLLVGVSRVSWGLLT